MMTNEEAIEILKGIMDDDTDHHIAWACGASDAFEMAIEALEKQIPKKVRREHHPKYGRATFCPNCSRMDVECWFYCPDCGQAIDWSE